MEDTTPNRSQWDCESIWPGRWNDGRTLTLLLLLTLGVRGWIVWATPVPARDSIAFIRIALQFEKQSWSEVLPDTYQHPGYPLTILVTSWPIRYFHGETDCVSMLLSAQLAGMLAGWLLVIPMFFMGKLLFGRSVGFWGALLFQFLPVGNLVLSEAVSDPLFLLMTTTGLLFGMRAITRNGCPIQLAFCGFFTGLAYLVRPEALLLLLAVLAVLAIRQILSASRGPWRRFLLGSVSLMGACILAGSPYVLATGTISNKPSIKNLLRKMQSATVEAPVQFELKSSSPTQASFLAVHINKDSTWQKRAILGLKALLWEFAHSYQYIGCIPLLLGLWWCRDRYKMAATWVGMAYFLIHASAVWFLALVAGYVSSRHVLILVVCTIFMTTVVVMQIPYRLLALFQKEKQETNGAPISRYSPLWHPSRWVILLLVLFLLIGLSRLLRPLHENRRGHQLAGQWLAQNTQPIDVIHDDHCWARFYAGRVFQEFQPRPLSSDQKQNHFFVITRTSQRNFPVQDSIQESDVRGQGGEIVYAWPENALEDHARVVIYKMP